LPSWNDTRVALGLPPLPRTVGEFAGSNADLAARMEAAFGGTSLADVDLLVGGLLESAPGVAGGGSGAGGLLGPTFAELLRKQFAAIRNADPWWYAQGMLISERSALALENATSLLAILQRNVRPRSPPPPRPRRPAPSAPL